MVPSAKVRFGLRVYAHIREPAPADSLEERGDTQSAFFPSRQGFACRAGADAPAREPALAIPLLDPSTRHPVDTSSLL